MRALFVTAALACVVAAPAAAQAPEPRVFVGFDAGVQPAGSAISDRIEWLVHLETATAGLDYAADAAPWFGGGIGVRVWKRLGVGVAFSRFNRTDSATIEARIPHPFFFERPRSISGEAGSLDASETAIHGQIMYFVPTKGRLRLVLSAGPSRIEAERVLVSAIRFDEEFPFDEATFQTPETRRLSDAGIGFNAGADLAFMFTRAFGVGAMVRYSGAGLDLSRPDGVRIAIDGGGFQAGAGVRVAIGRRAGPSGAPKR